MYFQKHDHQGLKETGLVQHQGGWQELMINLLGKPTPRILGPNVSDAGVTFLHENMSLAQLGSHGYYLRGQ